MRVIQTLIASIIIVGGRDMRADGYLAVVGPAPLRFTPRNGLEHRAVLPALSMGDEPSEVPNEATVETPTSPDADPVDTSLEDSHSTSQPTVPDTAIPPSASDPAAPETAQAAVLPFGQPRLTPFDVMITPQMLMHFFTERTISATNSIRSIALPLEFMPALPPATPSSTIQYTKETP